MSIKYAILGILSARALTGYDIKKLMQDSPFMYWSGNNNQVYKALVELLSDGLAQMAVHHQDGAPSRKVYAITGAGLAALKKWSLTPPEAPEIKNAFLVQLAWAGQLSYAELMDLLDRYEREIKGRLMITESGARRFSPDRTPREAAVWDLIDANIAGAYRQELDWTGRARGSLARFAQEDPQAAGPQTNTTEGEREMEATFTEKGYLCLGPNGRQILSERDGLDLIAACAEHGTNLLLIDAARLSEDFLRLRTGLAGAVMQKFAQYSIRVAIVLDRRQVQGKLKEYLAELNRGDMFHTYPTREEAEQWLLKGREA